jgi:hypothetical protein
VQYSWFGNGVQSKRFLNPDAPIPKKSQKLFKIGNRRRDEGIGSIRIKNKGSYRDEQGWGEKDLLAMAGKMEGKIHGNTDFSFLNTTCIIAS